MANEISVTAKLTFAYGGTTITNATSTDSITLNTSGLDGSAIQNVQTVGTSREALVVGDVDTASAYFVLLRNKDATNYVTVETYDSTNYVASGIMYAGELYGPVRVPAGKTIHLTANTAACQVETVVCEAGVPA